MKFGITQPFKCSYLPNQQEQLLVYADQDDPYHRYGQLIQAGFRRSGDQIYRPHCHMCDACQSIRIPIDEFTLSKSQKRLLNKNSDLTVRIMQSADDDYYPMYERYITHRHHDGTMYPPSREQYASFMYCQWRNPLYLEARLNDTLLAVAVTDDVAEINGHSAWSALYSFFAPEEDKRSLGTWLILQQIIEARNAHRQYLYLGYQVDQCDKMNYKARFFPHERFHLNNWQRFDKKPT